ncbi:unnamed protein product [Gadus morhua 'NCC']
MLQVPVKAAVQHSQAPERLHEELLWLMADKPRARAMKQSNEAVIRSHAFERRFRESYNALDRATRGAARPGNGPLSLHGNLNTDQPLSLLGNLSTDQPPSLLDNLNTDQPLSLLDNLNADHQPLSLLDNLNTVISL